MDIQALQLASRFSFVPNSLGYCGRDSATQRFVQCVSHGVCSAVDTELTKFIALYPYLKTIARITSQPVFSLKVIESYWLGNDLLKKAKLGDYKLLLEAFTEQGIPEWLVDELHDKPPRVFIPNHLFQVLHVGVGKASGAVPFNIDSINNCMIRWGKVEKISSKNITTNLNSLKVTNGRYSLTNTKNLLPSDNPLVKNLQQGDTVAVHWNMIVKKLNVREEKNLALWTKQICATVTN